MTLPTSSCDCHVHVFDPERFPYAAARAYTPGVASIDALMSMHQILGIARVVLVQPSIYGADNRATLHAIQAIGLDKARGVAVVDLDAISDEELHRLHGKGIRGIRLNLHTSKDLYGNSLDEAKRQLLLAKRLQSMHRWHVQVYAGIATHAALLKDYAALNIPVVLDHFAGAVSHGATDSISDLQLQQVLAAMRQQALYIKLSAAYRLPTSADAQVLAKLFYTAAPNRVLWGSDWPHTGGGTGGSGGAGRKPDAIEPFRNINNDEALQLMLDATDDPQFAQKMLVDNPAHLYDF